MIVHMYMYVHVYTCMYTTILGSRGSSPRDKEVPKVPAGAVKVLPFSSDGARGGRAGEGDRWTRSSGVTVEKREDDSSSWDRYKHTCIYVHVNIERKNLTL